MWRGFECFMLLEDQLMASNGPRGPVRQVGRSMLQIKDRFALVAKGSTSSTNIDDCRADRIRVTATSSQDAI